MMVLKKAYSIERSGCCEQAKPLYRIHAGPPSLRSRTARMFIAMLAMVIFSCASASAQAWLLAEEQTRLGVGVGVVQLFDSDRDLMGCVELRPGVNFRKIHPWLLAGIARQGCWYVAAGVLMNINLSQNWLLTPSFGGGYYDSNQLDLGLHGEFRSALEISRRLKNGHRLGLSLAHLSNGSFGDINPGTETLSLTYRLPLEWIFGKF